MTQNGIEEQYERYHRIVAAKDAVIRGDIAAVHALIGRLAVLHCAAVTQLGYQSLPTVAEFVHVNSVLSSHMKPLSVCLHLAPPQMLGTTTTF